MTNPEKNDEMENVKDTLERIEASSNPSTHQSANLINPYTTQYLTPSQFLYGLNPLTPTPSTSISSSSTSLPSKNIDPDYLAFMAQYGGQGNQNVTYEAKRATRQMSHYFDVNQHRNKLDQQTSTTTITTPQNGAIQKKKPTKKELEQFRKRKEERKRIKNRWLFE